jgi:peroxidase
MTLSGECDYDYGAKHIVNFTAGAHTVGSAHCQFFTDRLYNFLGTGQPDPSLNTTYLATLQATCPNKQAAAVNDTMVAVALDDGSQFNFDTSYFTNIQNNKGLLRIDAEIGSDRSTSPIVNTLAASANPSSLFDKSFVSSIVAMGEIGVLVSGTVRTVCSDIATA